MVSVVWQVSGRRRQAQLPGSGCPGSRRVAGAPPGAGRGVLHLPPWCPLVPPWCPSPGRPLVPRGVTRLAPSAAGADFGSILLPLVAGGSLDSAAMKHLLFGLLLLGACGDGEPTGITADNLTCPPGATDTYANFGQAFVQTNCLLCHETNEQPHLATQADVKTHMAAVLQQSVFTTAMPQDATLTVEERRRFGEWLECGAP